MRMNIDAISSVTPIRPVPEAPASAGTASTGGTEESLLMAMEASSTGISPTASFLSHLEMLQVANPAEFSKVAASISQQLQIDAKTAALDGNVTQADKLNHVAAVFQASVESGQLPTIDSLHAAGVSRDHFHGHETAAGLLKAAIPSPASDSIESIIASEVTIAIGSQNR
ncbi:MAG TPA: hypothetical protein VNU44_01750 [Bryobacteraceae bacterium]|jgi:hypothetical protein|nr:hypothetical protein [Bryobacteraceae bacterium]